MAAPFACAMAHVSALQSHLQKEQCIFGRVGCEAFQGGSVRASPTLLTAGVEGLHKGCEDLVMARHVGAKNKIDDERPQIAIVLRRQVCQKIALWPEQHG